MKQTIYAPNTVPTANIAVNKSRLKVYKNAGELPTYYLQKGQEFQIELFNPTSDVILAKIIINGKAISQGGLVLNPGQRVYLERYLDVEKKFLFDTYEVGKSAEVMAAIKNNGDFKVEFYKEQKQTFTITPNYVDHTYRPHIYFRNSDSGGYGSLDNSLNGGFPISGSINLTNTTGTINLTGISHLTNTSNPVGSLTTSTSSYSNNQPTLDSFKDELQETQSLKRSGVLRSCSVKSKNTIETGRVEMGSTSDQKLKYVDKKFDYFAFHTIEYKMLPVSQKINTVEDINIKRYCTQCGAKVGKTDNFCSSCGKKA